MVIPVMAGILFSKKDSTDKSQEARLLHFGTAVLIGLRLVFGFMMAMYFGRTTGGSNQEGPEDIRCLCYGNSPPLPLVTLVLGYYFGKKTIK